LCKAISGQDKDIKKEEEEIIFSDFKHFFFRRPMIVSPAAAQLT